MLFYESSAGPHYFSLFICFLQVSIRNETRGKGGIMKRMSGPTNDTCTSVPPRGSFSAMIRLRSQKVAAGELNRDKKFSSSSSAA
jgi:hypothetical protein